MKVVNNLGEIIEVTETAYNILFKERGFKPVGETVNDESTSSTPEKVTKNGRSNKSR